MSSDKYLVRTESLTYDPWSDQRKKAQLQQQEDKDKSDSLYINKKVNGWGITLAVDEYGKIEMIAHKTIGKLAGVADAEATVNFSIVTTEKRAPPLKIVGHNKYYPEHIEIDDGLERTTESFKEQDKEYKREYHGSSVLTPNEFFSEIIPEFEELLKEKSLDEYCKKFAESSSKVQKPYNRNYRLVK